MWSNIVSKKVLKPALQSAERNTCFYNRYYYCFKYKCVKKLFQRTLNEQCSVTKID